MNYNSLEYVKALICETFGVTEKDFDIKPFLKVFYVENNEAGGPANTVVFSSIKEYIFGMVSIPYPSVNYVSLCLNLEKESERDGTDTVQSLLKDKSNPLEVYGTEVLFNYLLVNVAAEDSTTVVVKGWKVIFNNR